MLSVARRRKQAKAGGTSVVRVRVINRQLACLDICLSCEGYLRQDRNASCDSAGSMDA